MKKIGLTASREPRPQPQLDALKLLMEMLGPCELHHGDCVGGDEQAHDMAVHAGWRIVVHPGTDTGALRAWCRGDENRSPKANLKRNWDIVVETSEMIALPKGPEELRSGTWSTIRKARKAGRPVTVIWPDGRVEQSVEDLV